MHAGPAVRPLPPQKLMPAGRDFAVSIAILVLIVAALWIGWTGFIASDDASYYQGAALWVADPPFPGGDHWTTRFPLVLSLAAAIAVTGGGEIALALTALFWFVAFLLTGLALAASIGDRRTVFVTSILLGTLPLTATIASFVNCDLPEVTFLGLGMLALMPEAAGRAARPRAALAAGFCFGLAILCRETAVLALSGLGAIFLLGRPVSRRSLLIAAAGAAAVLGGEMLFQWWASGDPLHRYSLALNHDEAIDRAANLEGNLLVHPLVDPLLVLLVNNEFGLLFWLAGAALIAGAHRRLAPEQRRQLALLAALGLAAALLVAVLFDFLVLNPRYFTVTVLPAALLPALWLGQLDRRWRFLLLGAIVSTNLLLLSAQNANPRWPATALARAAAEHPDRTIVASAKLVHFAELPLQWSGLRNVASSAPGAGSLYLVEEAEGAGRVLARYPSPPRPIGTLVTRLGLASLLPDGIVERLVRPNPTMLLIDRPAFLRGPGAAKHKE